MTDSIIPTPIGYYVYLHRKKSDFSVFYVGKGKKRRAWDGFSRSKWWRRVVDKHGRLVEIVKDGLDEPSALSLEKELISSFRKTNILVNITDGGGGVTGYVPSPETRAKISAFHKGKKLSQEAIDALVKHNRGRKRTVEERLKMSLAKKGKSRPPHSEETRKKISMSHIGIKPSPATLEKMSASKKGKFVGRDSPTYDHTIRTFTHDIHGVFEGTRGDLILKYGLRDSCVSALISKKQKTVKGWRIL